MTLPLPPMPRNVGSVNWIGLWTLYAREVRRFIKVHQQTVWAPVVTTLLYYAVFALSLGSAVRMVGSVPYLEFLAPGLIMMAMVQNAFANTSSSVVIAKVQGNIVDILMPPLSPMELVSGFVFGGVTRGIVVGLVTGLAIWAVIPLHMPHPGFVLFHAVMASMLLSLLGLVGGVWSEKFDNIAAVTNFVVTPLSFLSGTFYSVDTLPEIFWWVAHFDPFFYMIDGFRYGFVGTSDGSRWLGVAVMLGVNAGLWWLAWRMFKTGYKLKA
ncbi:ABC transporter permease [Azospirillum picis]|uniref:Transport permease protein n=1 Tax=Azospirillum picis TaxID=488438 RepID=A0ABU0MQD6_9PROT|nr:ABC transporter permease [Azospirillum picis]MBP2301737.1 ABC-2 type transport system permease protein [Azospirillum picis]MDQ0535439.1 ABC-2 type transport system permease protein [Azospirillum picis]